MGPAEIEGQVRKFKNNLKGELPTNDSTIGTFEYFLNMYTRVHVISFVDSHGNLGDLVGLT